MTLDAATREAQSYLVLAMEEWLNHDRYLGDDEDDAVVDSWLLEMITSVLLGFRIIKGWEVDRAEYQPAPGDEELVKPIECQHRFTVALTVCERPDDEFDLAELRAAPPDEELIEADYHVRKFADGTWLVISV